MGADIVHIADHRPPEVVMKKRVWTERFGDEVYTVQKSTFDHDKGFVTVRDAKGVNILVRPAGIPDVFMRDVIMAWRTGLACGLARGRDAAGDMLAKLTDRMDDDGEIE